MSDPRSTPASKSGVSRRRLLLAGAGGIALAVGTTPAWLRRAFADACPPRPKPTGGAPPAAQAARLVEPHSPAVVAAAYQTARTAGKALLVVVIPAADAARWERGELFGALMNHGTAEQLAPFALFEVVCATIADLRAGVAAIASAPNFPTGEPLAVVVETDGSNGVTSIDGALPPPPAPSQGGNWTTMLAAENAAFDARLNRLAQLVAHATLDDRVAVDRWTRQATAARGGGAAQQLLADLAGGRDLDVGRVDRGAAILAQHAQHGTEVERAHTANLLGAAAAARLTKRPVAGSYWATGAGCGVEVEGGPPSNIGCGMGHVPDKARRFLYFAAPGYW